MGQPNTGRIEHLIQELPNSFRDTELFQILNDLDEERIGLGYSEVIRQEGPLPPFVSVITNWNNNSKEKKRVETTFNRNEGGPLVTSIQIDVYNQEGSAICAVITAIITRTGNNQVSNTNVQITRP